MRLTSHLATLILSIGLSLAGLTDHITADEGTKTPPLERKVLFIAKKPDHPFGTHMYEHTLKMLASCARKVKGVEAVVSVGWPKDRKVLEGVKTIVVYSSPAAELLLDGPGSRELDGLMKKGVGLMTIHWASSVFDKNLKRLGDRWIGYLGGTWVSNVGLSTGKSPLKQLLPEHPICRGWKEYELHDEFYLDPTIKAARPLIEVTTAGKNVTVGWVHERKDGGRAFATTLGHFYKNFQIEAFRRMIINGILWTAHVEVPKSGADVRLTKKELALPPKPEKAKKK